MNAILCIIAAATCTLILGTAAGYLVGFRFGEQRGRDMQRVDDIQEMWFAMPKRDARGRFARKTP